MRLFFLRHGVAANREEWSGAESERPLTSAGREEMERVAQGLVALGLGAEVVITSAFSRADETARIAAAALGVPVAVAGELAPGATLAGLLHVLQAHDDAGRVLLVGHEPDFSQMIGGLIATPRPASLDVKKGGCARVDLPRRAVRRASAANDLCGAGTLAWLLTPRQIVLIGGQAPLRSGAREGADDDHSL